MNRESMQLGVCIVALAMSAAAQSGTPVTNNNDGTTSAVPVYSGSATLTNSPISISNGNVGIGTTNPGYGLSVERAGTQMSLSWDGTNSATFDEEAGASARLVVWPGPGNSLLLSGTPNTSPVNLEFTRFDGSIWHQSLIGYDDASDQLQLYSNGGQVQLLGGNGLYVPGSVGIGTTSPGATLEVNGNFKLTTNSGASITFQDGTTQSTAYTGVTCGGDYAESVDVAGKRSAYEPGDVLVISSSQNGDVVKSNEPYSTLVAGIYSTKPGTVGRRQTTPTSPDEIPMAMVGIVPTKVSAENGPIHKGDLLVTASLKGYAMKGTDRGRMLGAVIGKAMGTLNSGTGTIEVLVTLQ